MRDEIPPAVYILASRRNGTIYIGVTSDLCSALRSTGLAALAKCDDKLLQELGILRDEVLWAMRLPLSQNSQLALEGRAFMRARH